MLHPRSCRHWHVPHFEKMTYDNPQLACTYLAAFQQTGGARCRCRLPPRPLPPARQAHGEACTAHEHCACHAVAGDVRYAAVARGVLDYLRRDMTHPAGGIYSAEVSDGAGTAPLLPLPCPVVAKHLSPPPPVLR